MDSTLDSLLGPSEVGRTAEDPKSTAIVYLEKNGILRLMQPFCSVKFMDVKVPRILSFYEQTTSKLFR
ncbi:unnamed protein product [Schistosoma intercalatum]|nr:unnamed protein product [Schistosoma intercalatum]